ncbi:sigma factor-like helix-turn-helix DNA-binding protein [Streptomyces sp. NPDC091377]|uniref:sigma factor-like helix-turn-helix DNA-binding protein n=1 Tax=Streptomyces sp. NPDC091377 TaxID=3365995 RepID=UPI0038025EE0
MAVTDRAGPGTARPADERRAAFTLTQVVGLPHTETAELTDCPTGTVRSRVARARVTLLDLLSEPENPCSDRRTSWTAGTSGMSLIVRASTVPRATARTASRPGARPTAPGTPTDVPSDAR